MKKLASLSLAVLVFAAMAVFAGVVNAQYTESTSNQNEIQKREKFEQLITAARETGSARVIVGLKSEFKPHGTLRQAERQQQLFRIKEEQTRFLNRHQAERLEKVKQYQNIPFLAFETDAETLQQMQNDPQILTIEKDELAAPTLAESTAIVGAPAAWAGGFSGSGTAIAVLDTGVDKNHPFLSGKVVSEACYSSTFGNATSVCPNGVSESTQVDSGVNCATTISGCAHGTHVAGIAAGRGSNFSGVAKDASIIAIQVFSRFDNATDCGTNPVPCVLSYTSDQLKALDRVLTLSQTMNIAAVNMSLGGGQYTSNCDSVQSSRKIAIDNLRSAGIATVISSGNNGYTSSIGAPACISSAVSVGSTDDGSFTTTSDAVSNFSNSASFLTLLAPGRWIASSVPGTGYSNYSGTSMAAPHVAGAFAILKQNKPTTTVSQSLRALLVSGHPITDTRNNITKSRIRIDRAITALNSKRTPFDYDGDGRAEVSVYRPAGGNWFLLNSSNGSFTAQQFGLSDDLPSAADFDGDGKTDVAVFRPSSGTWFIINSSTNSMTAMNFGTSGDMPVPGDFDGDSKADIAIFRPSNGTWWITRSSNNQVIAQQFGTLGDKPVIGDFDGDGKTDYTVYRPSAGTWFRINSSNNQFSGIQFGVAEDYPTAADFDGDAKTDIAVYRPSLGNWFILSSATNGFSATKFGISEDKPAPADFDGDGRADLAVFRPSSGTWFLLRSTQGFTGQQFGLIGDIPTPHAFIR